jgi:hypothetical protein
MLFEITALPTWTNIFTNPVHHARLSHIHDITIVATFSCHKVSARFLSTALLTSNVDYYNEQLQLLSDRMNFSHLNVHITDEHLHHDLMHLKFQHKNLHYGTLISYFNELTIKSHKYPKLNVVHEQL